MNGIVDYTLKGIVENNGMHRCRVSPATTSSDDDVVMQGPLSNVRFQIMLSVICGPQRTSLQSRATKSIHECYFPIRWLFLLRILIQSNSINTPNYSSNKNLKLW